MNNEQSHNLGLQYVSHFNGNLRPDFWQSVGQRLDDLQLQAIQQKQAAEAAAILASQAATQHAVDTARRIEFEQQKRSTVVSLFREMFTQMSTNIQFLKNLPLKEIEILDDPANILPDVVSWNQYTGRPRHEVPLILFRYGRKHGFTPEEMRIRSQKWEPTGIKRLFTSEPPNEIVKDDYSVIRISLLYTPLTNDPKHWSPPTVEIHGGMPFPGIDLQNFLSNPLLAVDALAEKVYFSSKFSNFSVHEVESKGNQYWRHEPTNRELKLMKRSSPADFSEFNGYRSGEQS